MPYMAPDMATTAINGPDRRPARFCAGVDRRSRSSVAIQRFGPPVYVRHEIVHNRFVVERLRGSGAVFVKELDEVRMAPGDLFRPWRPKSSRRGADRGLDYLDATCLWSARSTARRAADRGGRHIIFIGHAGHPE
jgi:4-hydroxy-3-methylbut-2-enyl diphosphate reductase